MSGTPPHGPRYSFTSSFDGQSHEIARQDPYNAGQEMVKQAIQAALAARRQG